MSYKVFTTGKGSALKFEAQQCDFSEEREELRSDGKIVAYADTASEAKIRAKKVGKEEVERLEFYLKNLRYAVDHIDLTVIIDIE